MKPLCTTLIAVLWLGISSYAEDLVLTNFDAKLNQRYKSEQLHSARGVAVDIRNDGDKSIQVESFEIQLEANTKVTPDLLLIGTPHSWANEPYQLNQAAGLKIGGPRNVTMAFKVDSRIADEEKTLVRYTPENELILPPGIWRFAIRSKEKVKLLVAHQPKEDEEHFISFLRNPWGKYDTPESWGFGHHYLHRTKYIPPKFRLNGAIIDTDPNQYPAEETIPARMQEFSGVIPHLTMYNNREYGESGVGAVVNWQGNLWAVTYGPNHNAGSTDRLFRIDQDYQIYTHPDSAGGTPANRMIHAESEQLIIGNHFIDKKNNVRTIHPLNLRGRITGTARHLTDPENKVYVASMEEGLYEVDVNTLEVKTLHRDWSNHSPGNHGKGLYSGQGRLIYTNNGGGGKTFHNIRTPNERLFDFKKNHPNTGSLNTWDGKKWTIIKQTNFLDASGPGGIRGNSDPKNDPVWSMGWDFRSVILTVLDQGQWHTYRLPKGSHTMDDPTGINTEWPRIGEIGEKDERLMYVHGMFWKLPTHFAPSNSSGLRARSTYLRMVSDSTKWQDRIVFGCNEVANETQAQKLNYRKVRGIRKPTISHGSLWFVEPERLDDLGVPFGVGSVWSGDNVKADTPSDPYQFGGWDQKMLHLSHESRSPVTFSFQLDEEGKGEWTDYKKYVVHAAENKVISFADAPEAEWIRVSANIDAEKVIAAFHYSDFDDRPSQATALFDGIARPEDERVSGGLLRMKEKDGAPLSLVTEEGQYYEMGSDMKLTPKEDPETVQFMEKYISIPDLKESGLTADKASVVYIEERPQNGVRPRYRLPRGSKAFDQPSILGDERADRELVRERTVFNTHGIFYELPARNSGGFRLIRPITTHNRRIKDYAPWKGLLVISGVDLKTDTNRHLIRSTDHKTGVWVGAIDDLWKMGKAVGYGGTWYNTTIKANEASDPYLMNGFDQKTMKLSHQSDIAIQFTIQVDVTGYDVDWKNYKTFTVQPGETLVYNFPRGFNAYWIRTLASEDTVGTAQFIYE